MAKQFQKLTRNQIRSLAVGKKISELGIEYTRLADGDGRFTVNIMVDGKRIHRVVGKESEGVTRQQAHDLITQLRSKAREKRLQLPKGRKLAMGFEEAAKLYLLRLKEENGKDLYKKNQRLQKNIIPFFKDSPLSEVNTSGIERYKQYRCDENAKPSTINRELAVISHLLNKALDWQWIEAKPCNIKKLRENNGRIKYLTLAQLETVLTCAKSHSNPHIYAFIKVAIGTSMRLMEILSTQIHHIDINRRVIYIPKAKAGAREQPMTSELADFLSEYLTPERQKSQWLFPSKRSKAGHVINVEHAFRSVIKDAGLDPNEVVRHTLRHTVITHLVQSGVDLPTVQRISGHKTLQMVARYSHQNGEHIQAAMDVLEKRYSSVSSDKKKTESSEQMA